MFYFLLLAFCVLDLLHVDMCALSLLLILFFNLNFAVLLLQIDLIIQSFIEHVITHNS